MMTEMSKMSRRSDLKWSLVEDRAVLVDDAEGKVYQLDELATFIWQRLDGHQSLKQILNEVLETYEVELKKAKRHLFSFLQELRSKDLIS